MQGTVAEVMTADVVTLRPESTFREAVRLVEEHHVHALPVLDDAARVVGIVAESDLLLKEELFAGLPNLFGRVPMPRRERARAMASEVREIMTHPVVTVSPDTPLGVAARTLHRRRIGRLPVVDESGRLQGIVTRSDLLRVFLREDDDLCGDVQQTLQTMGRPFAGAVSCNTREGHVVLEGALRLRSHALEAERRVRALPGVCGVTNSIEFETDDVNVGMVAP